MGPAGHGGWKFFLIRGSPPPKGTKVWVFGFTDIGQDPFEDSFRDAMVYMDPEDIKAESYGANSYIDLMFDILEDAGTSVDDFVNSLILNQTGEDFYLHEISLP